MAFVDQFRHQQGVVKRGFSSGHLNKAWVADLTYIIATEPKITYIVFIALSFHVLLLTGGAEAYVNVSVFRCIRRMPHEREENRQMSSIIIIVVVRSYRFATPVDSIKQVLIPQWAMLGTPMQLQCVSKNSQTLILIQ